MKRLLVDINVLLDAILVRPLHAGKAAGIWDAVEGGRVTGVVSAHEVTTLFYLLARARGAVAASRAVADVLRLFEVAPVDEQVLRRALNLGWADFEDAVSVAAAEEVACDFIVSRDPAGFRMSPVETVDPASALALLERPAGPERVSEPGRASYRTRRAAAPARRTRRIAPSR